MASLEDGENSSKGVHVTWLRHNGLKKRDDGPTQLKEGNKPPWIHSRQYEVARPKGDNLIARSMIVIKVMEQKINLSYIGNRISSIGVIEFLFQCKPRSLIKHSIHSRFRIRTSPLSCRSQMRSVSWIYSDEFTFRSDICAS